MKTNEMSAKRFARAKLSGKTTAEAFLEAHRNFLNKHTFLAPILEAYDSKDILPTPTLQACQAALFDHAFACELKTAEHKIAQAVAPKVIRRGEKKDTSTKKKKGYTITVMVKTYDRDNNVIGEEVGKIRRVKEDENGKKFAEEDDAIFEKETFGDAQRKADRALFLLENSLHAIIENNVGEPIKTSIPRTDAIARMLPKSKSPFSKVMGANTSKLGFGIKAKNDHCSFSRG